MKWRILFFLSIAELLSMALWFSATAVIPSLLTEWHLDESTEAWLTMSVQIGFVAGTLISAIFNISDIFNARYVFSISAFLGAIFNGVIGFSADSIGPALILRFLTGVCLAGVYPPAMKIMATWFKKGRGMAIGILVGALVIGSASPHLFKVLGSPNWRDTMLIASASSIIAGVICLLFVKDGPHLVKGTKFNLRYIGKSLRDHGVRLANFGYLGHMWEIYAMWTWLPLFLLESYKTSGVGNFSNWAAISTFFVIATGGIGCVIAGLLADRYGRATITIVSMIISGICCTTAGLLFGGSPIALLLLCLVWGFTVPADSAQFSASVTELEDPAYIGTSLTLQTSMGFLLTLVSIRLVPAFVDWVGWQWAFAFLALGPLFGILSMYRLKELPVAARIGGERNYNKAPSLL